MNVSNQEVPTSVSSSLELEELPFSSLFFSCFTFSRLTRLNVKLHFLSEPWLDFSLASIFLKRRFGSNQLAAYWQDSLSTHPARLNFIWKQSICVYAGNANSYKLKLVGTIHYHNYEYNN